MQVCKTVLTLSSWRRALEAVQFAVVIVHHDESSCVVLRGRPDAAHADDCGQGHLAGA